jgi:SAM-dependent methyltransferase
VFITGRHNRAVGVPGELFDDDYLHFYESIVSDERSDADLETLARLVTLGDGVRVLDVPCGEGRIAGRLAALGCHVVGVDNNAGFLRLARERYPRVDFAERDMRRLDYEESFDLVVNWYTSFGYFDAATNDALLASLARALRPGGHLIVDLYNAARLRRLVELGGGASATLTERGADLMVDRITIDDDQGRGRTDRFIVRDGRLRKVKFSIELVDADALVRRLLAAGFRRVHLFGAAGGPFDPEGPRLIARAER